MVTSFALRALGARCAVTTHVSAWFGRDESLPTSGVSPIPNAGDCPCVRGSSQPRLNHDLTIMVTCLGIATPMRVAPLPASSLTSQYWETP